MARRLAVRLHWMWRKGSKYQPGGRVPLRSIEKLKHKWTTFTTRIIDVIAAEEMRISREEFHKQIETRTRELAHFKYSQSRAVDDALSRKQRRATHDASGRT